MGTKFSSGDKRTEEVSGQAASGAYTREIEVGAWEYAGIQANFTGLDAGDGEMKIQASVDGTNFDDYPGSAQTIGAGTSTQWWDIHTRSLEKLKIVWDEGSNTAGTFDLVSRKETPV